MKSIANFILLFSIFGFSQNNALFDQATTAYNEGKFEKAVENYLKIIESGEHSAALYFNLGNSYYKMKEVGPSIYYFEKALLLDPQDKEIKNNLAYAQNMAVDAIEIIPETSLSKMYDDLIGPLSFDQWAYCAIFFVLLFVLAYIVFYYLRYAAQKRIAFMASMVFMAMAIMSVVFAYLQYTHFKSENPAIVFSREVVIKSEPNDRGQEVFVLHEGTKVNVLEGLNDWNKIQIADGKTGWAPKENFKMLKDF